jgi:branched-chain amino acid transport system permease protein
MNGYIIAQQLINGVVLGAIYGLIAVGYTMVYGIMGMINFAHGEIYMLSAYLGTITFMVLLHWGIHSPAILILLTLGAAMLMTALYGWIIERLAYRPLRQAPRLAPLISAIGISLILQSYVILTQGAKTKGLPTFLEGVTSIGSLENSVQISNIQLLILIIALSSMAILNYIIQRTRFGQACRATQQDRQMAEILGINTDSIISSVFIIGSATAAIAGVLVTMNYGSFDFSIGFVMGIKAFTAAVLGGIGSLTGAMLGGILLGICESLFAGLVNSDYKDVFAFSLLVIFLIFRPSGLLGKPEVEKV